MTTDRETLQIIGSWMEDGRTRLPDHVLDAVLDQLPATPQRRPGWSARRIANMNPLAKYAIATAAVVVIAVVGFNLFASRGDSQVGVPPSSSPSSSPAPLVPETDEIVPAGRYRWATSVAEVSFDLPSGWSGHEGGIAKHENTEFEVGFGPNLPGSGTEVTHVYRDACDSAGALERIGENAEDLVNALEAQTSTDAAIRDVTAGSLTGQRVELRETPGLDPTTCRYGDKSPVPLQIWANAGETGVFAFVPGHSAVVYVFDVNGEPFVFTTAFGPEASEADVEAVDAIVESFEFSRN